MIRRVGILTGGGDVPGLNAVIQSLTVRLADNGCEAVGLRRGWASLINISPSDEVANSPWLMELNPTTTRRIDRTGGTVLHSSRLNPELLQSNQMPDGLEARPTESERPDLEEGSGEELFDATEHVLAVIDHLDLDALVAVGGDGTLSYANRLHQEGIPVIAIPKTMDNDVYGTDYSVGFSTAVTRSVHFINDLRTSAGSHERFLVVELFGRHSGEPCLLSSYLAHVDRALIAEVPFDVDRCVELLLADKQSNPSNYAILTVSEGAHPAGERPLESGRADAVGHKKLGGIGGKIAAVLERATGERALYQPLGYLMRSGPPDSLDLLVARNFGTMAADLLRANKTGLMTAVVGGRYAPVAVSRVCEGVRRVDVDRFYDVEQYRPQISSVQSLPMFLH